MMVRPVNCQAKPAFDSGGSVDSVVGAQVCGGQKGGTRGTVVFQEKCVQRRPAYPLEEVFDPTGAGDTFAGGFIGYLNKKGNRLDENTLHQALFYGTVMASFTVEKFSLNAC
jgi:sugar/nucleoside kinase (ribokinase family)